MEDCNTYVYFSLSGDDFDPDIITDRIGVKPTEKNRKGNKGKYNSNLSYSYWKLSTEKGKEYLKIDELINEIVSVLFDKIEIINHLKNEFKLESVISIVLFIDMNPEKSTPSIGHDMKTIEFLHRTKTITDVDIYRFNSYNKPN